MRSPVDRGVLISWGEPHDELSRLAQRCCRALRADDTLAPLLAGKRWLILVSSSTESGGREVGTMASLPTVEAENKHMALATILEMHVSVIRQFIQDNPRMKEEMLQVLRTI